MKGIDYSFIRLLTDFEKAKSDIAYDSEYFYNNAIVLHPEERYLQISNSSVDIAFDDSYKVELIDCNNNVLLDITDKIYISEFQDIDGIYQIAFEILPIEQDFYYKDVYFKFTHLDSTLVLYSNAVNITADNIKETFRLDYKSYSYNNGVSYDRAQFYQSIRILGYYNGVIGKEDATIYRQLNGKVRKSRIVQSFENVYKLDNINSFAYKRLFNALNSDLVYINGVRAIVTDDLTSDERQGKSNVFGAEFNAQLNDGEVYVDEFQILPNFDYIELDPLGSYKVADTPTTGYALFNENVNEVHYLELYNYDTDAFIDDLTGTIIGNQVNFSLPSLGVGRYYILGKFTSVNLVDLEISDKSIWNFKITTGDYSNADYDSNDYLTT